MKYSILQCSNDVNISFAYIPMMKTTMSCKLIFHMKRTLGSQDKDQYGPFTQSYYVHFLFISYFLNSILIMSMHYQTVQMHRLV